LLQRACSSDQAGRRQRLSIVATTSRRAALLNKFLGKDRPVEEMSSSRRSTRLTAPPDARGRAQFELLRLHNTLWLNSQHLDFTDPDRWQACCSISGKLGKEQLRVFEIGQVEPFGEPAT
jgi:hypothetical protein